MCEHTELTVINGIYVCTSCGTETDRRVYITSYNRSYSYQRPPVYSRQKRFFQFIRGLHEPLINENENDILTVFQHLEFFFNVGHKYGRKYFFNRYVTLYFILEFLCVPVKIRTLKDIVRVELQLQQMAKILKITLCS